MHGIEIEHGISYTYGLVVVHTEYIDRAGACLRRNWYIVKDEIFSLSLYIEFDLEGYLKKIKKVR